MSLLMFLHICVSGLHVTTCGYVKLQLVCTGVSTSHPLSPPALRIGCLPLQQWENRLRPPDLFPSWSIPVLSEPSLNGAQSFCDLKPNDV